MDARRRLNPPTAQSAKQLLHKLAEARRVSQCLSQRDPAPSHYVLEPRQTLDLKLSFSLSIRLLEVNEARQPVTVVSTTLGRREGLRPG